jgi:ComF family protein
MIARGTLVAHLAPIARAARACVSAARSSGASLARSAERFALPQRCAGCGGALDPERVLCEACERQIPRLDHSVCARCLAEERDALRCAMHPHHRVWSAWMYDERAARVIGELKFGARLAQSVHLARTLAAPLPAGLTPELVVPLPLHPARRRERGFSQTEQLARPLAARLSAPCVPELLMRVRHTVPQSALAASRRRENVREAFRCPVPSAVSGRAVLLVDDVVTTGSTLDAALGALAAAGARPFAATLARAL